MDTTTEDAPVAAPKKARKKAKPRRAKAAAAPVEKTIPADGIYAGLTVTDCCDGCNVDGCVVSGKSYCAHPRKGGLHSSEIQDSAALKRMNHAKRILGKQMLDARSGE
jgi:hypothetical protein